MEDPLISSAAIARPTSLEGDPLKRVFKNFLWKAWHELGFPDPTPLQYDMADYLQYGPDKSIVMAFRGAAKSYVTVAFALWTLYCDPDEIVLTVSATSRAATLNSFFAFQMINSFDWLAHMRPRTDQRQSALAFDVREASPKKFESFCSESLFGQITGRRANLIIPDDVEIPSTSDTEANRQHLRDRYGELGGAILLPKGRIKVLGTAQNEATIYTDLATDKGYGMRMWPILYPTPEERPKFGSWLAPALDRDLRANPALANTSTEPSRFDEADIEGRQLEWGRTEFLRQFKLHLDAGAGNAAPLKLRDLIVMDWGPPLPGQPLKLPPEVRWGTAKDLLIKDVPVDALHGDAIYGPAYVTPQDQWRPAEVVRMYVDPSGQGLDETTWPITAQLNAMAFLCHLGSSIEGHTESVLDQIAADAKLWGVNYIKVESNFGQGMFAALLRAAVNKINHPCTIEEDRKGSVQKERRIVEALEPPMTAHRIVVNTRVLQKDYEINYEQVEDAKRRFYRLTYQLTRLTKAKGAIAHDDRVDGLGSGIDEMVELLRQRTEDALKNDRDVQMMEEIDKLIATRTEQGNLVERQGGPSPTERPKGFGRGLPGGVLGSKLVSRIRRNSRR